jgi:hypothetical protein
MVEGYMEYQTMVYITQYIPKIDASINVDLIWDVNSIKKFEGEHLLGNGRMRKVTSRWWGFIIHLNFSFYVYHTYLTFSLPS